nr:sodium-coupled permease [Rubripirellula sp.]
MFTLALGWRASRSQSNSREYFIGSGSMNPVIVGISLFATLLSTISYLAIPGEVLGKGPIYLTNYVAYPFIFLIVGFVIIPVYMRQRVTSAYELLDDRLGYSARLLGGSMFLLLRLFWMSLMIYLTSKALTIMLGLDESRVPLVILTTSAFAIGYTSLGGLKAVVITDLLQTVLLYGGALLVIATITWEMKGFSWFPTQWQTNIWDTQPLFSLDPSTRVTVLGSIISVFLWTVCTSAGDQVSVQRFMATKDAAAARKAVAVQLVVGAVVGSTLGLVGVALLGYFQANSHLLPDGPNLKTQADELFPYFIANRLPSVVRGLVVSGLLAAAMSSIDSGINSITAVVMTDLKRKRQTTDSTSLGSARMLAIFIGVIVAVFSSIMGYIPGNFMAVTNKTVNLLTVPIALLFFFALYVPFASTRGVFIGIFFSVFSAATVAFSGLLFGMTASGNDPVSFQWISPIALLIGLSFGLLGSFLFPNKKRT